MSDTLLIKAGESISRIVPLVAGEKVLTIVVAESAALVLSLPGAVANGETAKWRIEAKVGKDAQLHCITSLLHGAAVEVEIVIHLMQPGAAAKVTAMAHCREMETQVFNVTMHHQAPHTTGDIAIRGVAEGKSKATFSGLIKIDPVAQQTKSYFRDDVLLLDQAFARSLPTLEIEANDVRASHGSTTSRINADQLFYLQSRGLDVLTARRMIVNGFVAPVLQRVPEAFCTPFQVVTEIGI
ncbi:MAG: SufD family Fe-S cluster assembly protein [Patescibacteria group bacterium]|jgi:Fe-S cluster assembly protein SufD